MTFKEAYKEMRNGKAIAHEKFADSGYWVWEDNTIMFKSYGGINYPALEAPDVGYILDMIVEDKWRAFDVPEEPIEDEV